MTLVSAEIAAQNIRFLPAYICPTLLYKTIRGMSRRFGENSRRFFVCPAFACGFQRAPFTPPIRMGFARLAPLFSRFAGRARSHAGFALFGNAPGARPRRKPRERKDFAGPRRRAPCFFKDREARKFFCARLLASDKALRIRG
jgi:hypothetical protein